MDVASFQVPRSNIPDESLTFAKNRYRAAESMIDDGSSSPAWEKRKTGCPRIKAVVGREGGEESTCRARP